MIILILITYIMRGKKGGGDKPITKEQAEKMLMEINSLMTNTKQSKE